MVYTFQLLFNITHVCYIPCFSFSCVIMLIFLPSFLLLILILLPFFYLLIVSELLYLLLFLPHTTPTVPLKTSLVGMVVGVMVLLLLSFFFFLFFLSCVAVAKYVFFVTKRL